MNRRNFLQTALRVTALSSISAPILRDLAWSQVPSLRSDVSGCSFDVGVSAEKALLERAPIANFVTQNFSLLTVSGMKWDHVHRAPQIYDFAEADWGVAFAEKNGIKPRGHTLCWNSPANIPSWLNQTANRSNAQELLEQHISAVASHFKGKLHSWDVVNEPVTPWSTRSDKLYPGLWVQNLGPEYIDIAFRALAEADPKPLRVMNLYNVEQGGSDQDVTRAATLTLLKQLVGRGVPIQAVGLESHLDASKPLAPAALQQFLQAVRGLGLKVLITEFDVKENRTTGDSATWDKTVQDYYTNYLSSVLAKGDPQAIIFWSVLDRWENGRRIQGLLQDSLIPRLSYRGVLNMLQQSCQMKSPQALRATPHY